MVTSAVAEVTNLKQDLTRTNVGRQRSKVERQGLKAESGKRLAAENRYVVCQQEGLENFFF